ncbi:MAG: helix-turn-helix domain-containing protein [bacterium]|nr:helix-turn-helix domain-containing protein [bacterium]
MEDFERGDFSQIFNERVKERGLSLKKLSELTGIAIKHLEALSSGNFAKMPSAPYFRGYLIKLGQILEFDAGLWWERLKTSGLVKDPSTSDAPPENRFIKSSLYKYLWIAVVAFAIALYAVLQFSRIFGRPVLTVTNPRENPAYISTSNVELMGKIENGNKLTVNGEFISLNPDGTWQKMILLQSGPNTFEISAKKFLGEEVKIVQQIIYEPATSTLPLSR